MKYAFGFLLLASGCIAVAVQTRGAAWLLLWPALSFLLVAIGYVGGGPRVLGKRATGRIETNRIALLLPFFLFTCGIWHARRLFRYGPACHEILPGVWLGRRPLARDLPAGTSLVVDLTAEFMASRGVITGRTYLCLPMLDGTCGDEALCAIVLDRLATSADTVYIHCAQGYGRSAMFAAALLVRRGAAEDFAAAEQMLRKIRPGVRLNRRQRAFGEGLCAKDAAGHPSCAIPLKNSAGSTSSTSGTPSRP